jgi:hypothetical protein
MAAISYQITLGQTLEQVTVGTNPPPTLGSVEIRMDTTGTSITDANYPGGTRALRRGEIYTLLKVLQEKVSVDPNLPQ